MAIKKYNRSNFHKHTFCVFTEVPRTEIEDRKPDYKSRSGSIYYFTEEGVFRLSDHWGRAAHCKWRLEKHNDDTSRLKVGYARWDSFHSDNDSEKLYFISIDAPSGNVTYEHINSGNHDGKALLRTASETTKIIRQIRNLLVTENWAKYFETDDIQLLRRLIINALINTNHSMAEIKSEIRNTF